MPTNAATIFLREKFQPNLTKVNWITYLDWMGFFHPEEWTDFTQWSMGILFIVAILH